MSENIYIGQAKEIKDYYFLIGSICLDSIPTDEIINAKNGKRYVNIKISKRRQPDQFGFTHSISINTYGKNGNQTG